MNTFLLTRSQSAALVGAVAVAVFAFVASLRETGTLQSLEFAQYDYTMTALAKPETEKDVALVTLSDEELAMWGWPLSDGKLAEISKAALDAGALAVGIDIYRDVKVGDGRPALSEVLADPRVISISKLGPDGQRVINPPSEVMSDGRFGFSDIPLDFDGVARRLLLLVATEDGVLQSFPMKLALLFRGQSELEAWPTDPRVLLFGDMPVPALTDGFGAYRGVDARGYQIPAQFPRQLPGAHIVSARTLLEVGDADAQLRDRIVLVGTTSHSVKDYFVTPLNRSTGAEFAFGLELHAAALQQLIDHGSGTRAPFKSLGTPSSLVILFLVALSGALAAVFIRSAVLSFVIGPGVALSLLFGLSAFLQWGWVLPAVPTTLAWVVAFISAGTLIAAIARRQRRAMAGLFTSHMSSELAQEIWRQRGTILAGRKPIPRRLLVTALMADIAGSTITGRSMQPAEFMDWISTVLDELGQIARSHGGFVEKFTGDGIFVVFGAPLPSETDEARARDSYNAAACAQAMASAITRLNEGGPAAPYSLRIGLHSGPVLGGTLGRSGAMQYNVIGDTVNVAARVEAWGKRLHTDPNGTTICLTGETVALFGDAFPASHVGTMEHDDGGIGFDIYQIIAGTKKE